MKLWLNRWLTGRDNQAVILTIIVCVTVLLLAAIYFGLDLSWLPGMLKDML